MVTSLRDICPNSGQPKDLCWCEACLNDDDPPWHEWNDNKIVTDDDTMTVTYVREQIKLITETVRKANRIPMERNGNKRGSSNAQPQRPQNGVQRLELKDLSIDKKRLTIMWAGDPSEAGVNAEWAVVSVKFQSVASGLKRIYTLGDNNPCLDCLEAGFGTDEKQWRGREIFAWKDVVGVQEKEFIRFACIDAEGKEIPFEYPKASTAVSSAASF